MERDVRVNTAIRIPEIRVIDDDGNQLGIMKTSEALKIAREKGLDLVEVQPNAKPPVCRIIDYGKFKFEKKKKEQEAKKNSTNIQIKEIKMRPKIDTHDFSFKMKHLEDFLSKGHKVRVTVQFRGREMQHVDLGFDVMNRVKEESAEYASMEKDAKMEGRNLSMILIPNKKSKKKKE